MSIVAKDYEWKIDVHAEVSQSKKLMSTGHFCVPTTAEVQCTYIQYPLPPQNGIPCHPKMCKSDILRGGNNYADSCFELNFLFYIFMCTSFNP